MFFPVKMRKLSVVASSEYADEVTRVLLNAGTVDISEPKEYVQWEGVRKRDVAIPQERVREIRMRIEGFLSMADEDPFETALLDTDSMKAVEPEQCDKVLDKLASDLQGIRELQKNLQQELFRLEELKEQLEKMPAIVRGVTPGDSLYISIHTGIIKMVHLEAFLKAVDMLNTLCKWEEQEDQKAFVVLLVLRREEKALDQLLERFHWETVTLPPEAGSSPETLLKELNSRIEKYRREKQEKIEEGKALIRSRRDDLLSLWQNVRVNELFDRIQLEFGETSRTILFTGWVPSRSSVKVESRLREVTGDNIYVEWNEVQDLKELRLQDVPVELNNPGLLKPFQLLVENYSLPSYGTIDPTPFTALTFFIMFGLMFGDAGQGVVILSLGLLGTRLFKFSDTRRKTGRPYSLVWSVRYTGGYSFRLLFRIFPLSAPLV